MSYIVYFAIISAAAGILVIPFVIRAAQHFGIDLARNLWVLAIPVVFSLLLNVLLVELYGKYVKK